MSDKKQASFQCSKAILDQVEEYCILNSMSKAEFYNEAVKQMLGQPVDTDADTRVLPPKEFEGTAGTNIHFI